ncbi:hypothetical protein BD769DRAFT_1472442 [Suillus cothurnatus]|nr:hypothetical protein BD769DRAFT_1472442 [Suillus cothurnatus]
MMIPDVLHRTFVAYGLFMGYAVHRETLAKGREAEAKWREQTTASFYEEAKELALAEAAQAVFRKGS